MDIRTASTANRASLPLLKKGEGEQLGQKDFLRLMMTQLTQQDPLNPVDNQAMVAQMAQFSSLAGISETNATLGSIAETLKGQTELLTRLNEMTASIAAKAADASNSPVKG